MRAGRAMVIQSKRLLPLWVEHTGPRVLHIATHGFFVPSQARAAQARLQGTTYSMGVGQAIGPDTRYNAELNPLLRSGVVLAGVSNAAMDERSLRTDGILTAYEAGLLNLQGTELVVLSACETGLGEVQAGEGIYGLQRSFQLAGAQAVITSLWRVDDSATQLLMSTFYRLWLSGISKQAAFRQAQLQVRQQYPEPYYWGAFVLVGH